MFHYISGYFIYCSVVPTRVNLDGCLNVNLEGCLKSARAIWSCYLLLSFALRSYVLGVALCASQREGRAGYSAGRLNVLSTGTHSRLSCLSEWKPPRTTYLEYRFQFSVPNQRTEFFFGGEGMVTIRVWESGILQMLWFVLLSRLFLKILPCLQHPQSLAEGTKASWVFRVFWFDGYMASTSRMR